MLTQADFEGQADEFVKSFYPDVTHLRFQMEECHKMLTDQVDWTNPEGAQFRVDVNRPLPLGGPPVQNMVSLTGGLIDRSSILTDMIICRIEKMSEHTCGFLVSSESKHTQDTGMTKPESASSARSSRSSSWFRQTNAIYCCQAIDPKLGDSTAGYEFKHDYTIIKSPRAVVFLIDNNNRKIMRFNEIYKFSDGTLTRILEALDYRVKEFKVKWLNPGMNTRFWIEKDMTRSKEFITAIERRLKTKRIYRNLECFVGGRVRDIDYRLLQRTE
ncbi:hypothetical protein Tco_0953356 [Tanacetum coccineum]|uniref:Uncharacterized protein n=1 Tax=Tanacetum coccineum TaxID=301880 RepID=A0ABQ5E2I5_9ASTR